MLSMIELMRATEALSFEIKFVLAVDSPAGSSLDIRSTTVVRCHKSLDLISILPRLFGPWIKF